MQSDTVTTNPFWDSDTGRFVMLRFTVAPLSDVGAIVKRSTIKWPFMSESQKGSMYMNKLQHTCTWHLDETHLPKWEITLMENNPVSSGLFIANWLEGRTIKYTNFPAKYMNSRSKLHWNIHAVLCQVSVTWNKRRGIGIPELHDHAERHSAFNTSSKWISLIFYFYDIFLGYFSH